MAKDNKEDLNVEPILAAGGILEKRLMDGPRIAVIYRERYGGEWCLPKGKVAPGESLEQAAAREVHEETGIIPVLNKKIGEYSYEVKGQIKTVFYWLMEVGKESSFKPSEEVNQLEWLTPREAIERFSHDDQKNLVRKVYFPETLGAEI